MNDFQVPLPDRFGVRESYINLVQAHEDLNRARKLRNRGVAMFAAGVSLMALGIYKLKNN